MVTQVELLQDKVCPPEKRAGATKPSVFRCCGFVVPSPSHALRDGEGTFYGKVNQCRRAIRIWVRTIQQAVPILCGKTG